MGLGDDLMITAQASQLKKKHPDRQIVIGSVSKKQAYHSIIYDNNPPIQNICFPSLITFLKIFLFFLNFNKIGNKSAFNINDQLI